MKCHKDCSPPEWTETWPDGKPPLHPYTGKPMLGTGVTKLKKGTGCIYTRDKGTGCCLLPTSGAVQPTDLAVPSIQAKRTELLAAARAEGDMEVPTGELAKAVKEKPESW
jgi:hypothetical protein